MDIEEEGILEDKINSREFCLVVAVLENPKSWQSIHEDWVIFESSLPLARKIATDFLKKRYMDRLNKMWIYPRKYLKEARICVAEGRIILSE